MSLLLDISGFEALFQVNYLQLVKTAYRITQDKDIAEDIVQDVFIKMWQNQDSKAITTSLKSYLFGCTINQSLNYIKKIRIVNAREELYSLESVNYGESEPELREMNRQTENALNLLPPACRTVFILSRYEQLSYKEIAHRLDLPFKMVEAQMVKALKHLRNCLLLFTLILISTFFF
jgi:RNA polymerase sigma-70 factor, ECF subfamily